MATPSIIFGQSGASPADEDTSLLESFSSMSVNDLGGGDEPDRTLNRPGFVWTLQLHKRFLDAVTHLGIENAVPETVMQLMNVDGLTRENVATHLQKYRLYLKRLQDMAANYLFARLPVPTGGVIE